MLVAGPWAGIPSVLLALALLVVVLTVIVYLIRRMIHGRGVSALVLAEHAEASVTVCVCVAGWFTRMADTGR